MEPLISVLIATYNRCSNLINIIDLLENQTLPKNQFEIIVTDSFSSDGTKEAVNLKKLEYNNIVYKEDCENILANKRNQGIKLAKSRVVLFLDDDVYPYDKHFLKNHYKANLNNNDTFYCGQVRFDAQLVEKSNYFRFRDDQHLKNDSIGIDLPFNKIVVMNLSFKKEFISSVGYVDERFVNYGAEDTEFGYRIVKNGFKIRYLDDAIAIHRENSKDIVEYSRKIAKTAMYGKKTLREINENVLNELTQSKFDKKNIFNNFLFNDFLGNMVKIFLIGTDKIRILYNYYLYKYYLFYVNYKYI